MPDISVSWTLISYVLDLCCTPIGGYLFWLDQSKLVKTVNYLRKGCVVIDHSDKLPDFMEKLEAVLADELATVCSTDCIY